uniref:Uncharacterized protein n=1 Tax=Palpitomonas bilix TaxID=652834 RepID=A0A7S3GJT0_9EUKA
MEGEDSDGFTAVVTPLPHPSTLSEDVEEVYEIGSGEKGEGGGSGGGERGGQGSTYRFVAPKGFKQVQNLDSAKPSGIFIYSNDEAMAKHGCSSTFAQYERSVQDLLLTDSLIVKFTNQIAETQRELARLHAKRQLQMVALADAPRFIATLSTSLPVDQIPLPQVEEEVELAHTAARQALDAARWGGEEKVQYAYASVEQAVRECVENERRGRVEEEGKKERAQIEVEGEVEGNNSSSSGSTAQKGDGGRSSEVMTTSVVVDGGSSGERKSGILLSHLPSPAHPDIGKGGTPIPAVEGEWSVWEAAVVDEEEGGEGVRSVTTIARRKYLPPTARTFDEVCVTYAGNLFPWKEWQATKGESGGSADMGTATVGGGGVSGGVSTEGEGTSQQVCERGKEEDGGGTSATMFITSLSSSSHSTSLTISPTPPLPLCMRGTRSALSSLYPSYTGEYNPIQYGTMLDQLSVDEPAFSYLRDHHQECVVFEQELKGVGKEVGKMVVELEKWASNVTLDSVAKRAFRDLYDSEGSEVEGDSEGESDSERGRGEGEGGGKNGEGKGEQQRKEVEKDGAHSSGDEVEGKDEVENESDSDEDVILADSSSFVVSPSPVRGTTPNRGRVEEEEREEASEERREGEEERGEEEEERGG